MNPLRLACTSLSLLALIGPVAALGPEDVYVVVNKNVAESQAIAEHYCHQRGVPVDHILALDLPKGEDISRSAYDEQLAGPLRELLKDKRDKVKVLLSIYGVPLRVGAPQPTLEEQVELSKLKREMDPLQKRLRELGDAIRKLEEKAKKEPGGNAAKELPALRNDRFELDKTIAPLENRRRQLSYAECQAAVDSELSLLWHDKYELRRWQMNTFYFQMPEEARKDRPLLMTCRLDGTSAALVKRIIDESIAVEKTGLVGKAYFDARGIKYDPKYDTGWGYGGYDESLRETARLLEKTAKLPVVLDDQPDLFAPGSCTECALYCGWYSHAQFVDCCRFVPGAVAYHIASSEAVSLRNPTARYWCKNLLEAGAVATLGPVAEPYTVGFPKPAEFFGTLVTGEFTLVECYWRTNALTSWMTVLVGDPLYNPYAKTPKMKLADVKPSPEGGRFLFGK